jgi:hypothetical protein
VLPDVAEFNAKSSVAEYLIVGSGYFALATLLVNKTVPVIRFV